jgi:hypothetical protein
VRIIFYFHSYFGKFEGKRTLGSPSRKWEDNIEINFKEEVSEDMNSTELVQRRSGDRLL